MGHRPYEPPRARHQYHLAVQGHSQKRFNCEGKAQSKWNAKGLQIVWSHGDAKGWGSTEGKVWAGADMKGKGKRKAHVFLGEFSACGEWGHSHHRCQNASL